MNLNSLRTFETIVERGSLVRASEHLNVTQSTVTARLKALEDALGQVLLVREKSGVSLTPAGAKFLKYARVMTGLWQQAQRESALPAGLEAMCTLGCGTDHWDGIGRQALDLITQNHHQMAVTILQGDAANLEQWLAEGLVDIIITERATLRDGQSVWPLADEVIGLFATRPNAPEVGNGDYIFVDHGEDFRREHGQAYFDADTARIEFSSSAWALEHMLRKGGVAYLPRDIAQKEVEAGRLFEVADAPEFRKARYLVVRDNAAKSWSWFSAFTRDLGAQATGSDPT